MKNIILILLTLATASEILFATPINFTAAGVNKISDVRRSVENPISLYLRTDGTVADGRMKFFVAQTLQNLNPAYKMPAGDVKALHKQICVSNVLQNAGATIKFGFMGLQVVGTKIVGTPAVPFHVHQRLDSILKTLGSAPAATALPVLRAWAAKYYAVAIADVILRLHTQDVILNNLDLNNFYHVDGALVPADLSEAIVDNDPRAKDADWKKFAVDTLPKLFKMVYPDSVNDGEFVNFAVVNALMTPLMPGTARYLSLPATVPSPSVAPSVTVASTVNWASFDWRREHVLNMLEMNLIGPNDSANGSLAGLFTAGGAATSPTTNDAIGSRFITNRRVYLQQQNNMPLQGAGDSNAIPKILPINRLILPELWNFTAQPAGVAIVVDNAIFDIVTSNLSVAPVPDVAALCALPGWQD